MSVTMTGLMVLAAKFSRICSAEILVSLKIPLSLMRQPR